jgi:subtilisin family serine protease
MSAYKVNGSRGPMKLVKSENLIGLKPLAGARGMAPRGLDEPRRVIPGLGGFDLMALQDTSRSANSVLDAARADGSNALGTHVFHIEGSDKPLIPNGSIIILFKPGVSELEQMLIVKNLALEVSERIDNRQVITKVTSGSPNPVKVAEQLSILEDVLWAEPDLDAVPDHYFDIPSPMNQGQMWHLQNNGSVPDAPEWKLLKGADSRVVAAWKRLGNTGSSKINIAILDVGFDLDHPDLRDRIIAPFDFWNQSPEMYTGDVQYTHGTPCASVALAPAFGGSGKLCGAAPNARFMPLSGTSYSLEGTRQMFDYAIEHGADIISCSWGTADPNFAPNNLKQAAISKAAIQGRGGKGCIVLYAAGNEGLDYINYYAQNPDVIAVGACTSQDAHADYSNMGPELTVVAPSNGWWPILAARASWDEGTDSEQGAFKWYMDGRNRGDQFQHFGGTSSATPLVAGICALILSANPNLTAAQVKQILKSTATKIGGPSEYDSRGFSKRFGYGRVDADKAVAEAIRLKNGGATTTTTTPTNTTPTTNTPTMPTSSTENNASGLFKFGVERAASSGFGVQIGNFASYGNVLVQVERMQIKFKRPVFVHINEYQGKTVYRVIVGNFAKAADAQSLMQIMKQNGVSGFIQDLSKLA